MSSAALAKKRRANMAQDNSYVPSPPVPNNTQPAANGKSYLSLPQILGLVEKRILAIESAMQEQKSAPSTVGSTSSLDMETLKPMLDEYDSRFEMLATEINELKDTVLKLQSFTMEVNQAMYEDLMEKKKNVAVVPNSTDVAEETYDDVPIIKFSGKKKNDKGEKSDKNEKVDKTDK